MIVTTCMQMQGAQPAQFADLQINIAIIFQRLVCIFIRIGVRKVAIIQNGRY